MLSNDNDFYIEIQRRLFYLIPERWEKIFLYTSIIDVSNKKPDGEMFFYYLPKGIIKKKLINGYEIPSVFDIDEVEYSTYITDLYNLIRKLRDVQKTRNKRIWSNIVIIVEDNQFKIEYGFENLSNMPFDSYERHIIWRYQYIENDISLYPRKDRNIIQSYQQYIIQNRMPKKSIIVQDMYDKPVKNIIDYERTMSVDEAIAQSKETYKKKKSIRNILPRKSSNKKGEDEEEDDIEIFNNQILNGGFFNQNSKK